MTTTQGTATAVGAVLLFWIVGAYNRLVRLRSELAARFAAVDDRHRQRHALLESQLALLSTALAAAGPRLDALRAACGQADTAREHARARPASESALTSLRVTEEILAEARSRLPVQAVVGAELPSSTRAWRRATAPSSSRAPSSTPPWWPTTKRCASFRP